MFKKQLGLALLCLGSISGGQSSGALRSVAGTCTVSRSAADQPDYLCDGIEDEVEINQAIRRVASAGGGRVLLRAGTFVVRRQVIVLPNVTFQGEGASTIIRLEDHAPAMTGAAGIVRLKDDSQIGPAKRVRNVILQDFVVDGNRANQSSTIDEKKYGVYSEGDRIVFRRVTTRNCAGYGFDPHAYSDLIPSTQMTIENCESYGNQLDGFTLDMVQNSTFTGNHAHHNDRHGINLVTGTTALRISGCRSVANGATGLTAQNGTHHVLIQTSEISNNTREGIHLRAADGCIVSHCTVKNNGRSGVALRGTDGAMVWGNTLTDNSFGTSGPAEISLEDYLNDDATNNVVRSNTIKGGSASAGVREEGGADYNQVDNNSIDVVTQHIVLIGPHSTQSGNILH